MEEPKIESSYFLEGKMRGVQVLEIGTFTTISISDNLLFEVKDI